MIFHNALPLSKPSSRKPAENVFAWARSFCFGAVALVLLSVLPGTARAVPEPQRFSVALYGARWLDSRLPLVPKNLVMGRLEVDDAWLAGLVVNWVAVDDFTVPLPFTEKRLTGFDLELEGQAIRHYGLQDHMEAAAALVVRTADWRPFEHFAVNAAWGNGLSYAFSDPAYEKGVDNVRGVDTRRLQYHMSFELEFGGDSRITFLTRIHHRSGVYGVISPQDTGSNYFGAGFRVALY